MSNRTVKASRLSACTVMLARICSLWQDRKQNNRLHMAVVPVVPCGLNPFDSCWYAWIMYKGKKKVTLTYDRHTAQRGYEWRWGKAVCSKVPQLPNTHESHTAPPHHRGVVGLGATLGLTDVGIFLSGREGTGASVRLSRSSNWRAAQGKL